MRVILNHLVYDAEKQDKIPIKPAQIYHCDNINQFVTHVVTAGALQAEFRELCEIVGYTEKSRISVLVEILQDLFETNNIKFCVDFD